MPTAENADELKLVPPDCPSAEDWQRALSPPPTLPKEEPPPPTRQYSIGELMILMVGVAAGLAGGSWMPTDIYAATLGLLTLIGLLVVSWSPPESRLGKLIWATLVLAYVISVFAAVFRPLLHGPAG